MPQCLLYQEKWQEKNIFPFVFPENNIELLRIRLFFEIIKTKKLGFNFKFMRPQVEGRGGGDMFASWKIYIYKLSTLIKSSSTVFLNV